MAKKKEPETQGVKLGRKAMDAIDALVELYFTTDNPEEVVDSRRMIVRIQTYGVEAFEKKRQEQ